MKTIKQKFIIDESGSMLSQKQTVINGFNEQIQMMRREEKEHNVRYLVSVTKFSETVTKLYTDVPLVDVSEFTEKSYSPCGGTALYDAIGMTIDTAELGEKDVVVCIMTDGQENSSRTWKKAAIKALVDIRTNENKWGFTYFGANQDAWAEASQLGVSMANSISYTVGNTALAMKAMGLSRCAYTQSAVNNDYSTISNLTSSVNISDLVK